MIGINIGNLFFTGQLVHIVGTNIGDRGRSCDEHNPFPCGSSLRVNDWVTFRLVQLNDEGLNEDAIEVRRIIQGQETCRVGFLQRTYIPHFQAYHGKVAQIREIWTANDDSATQRSMFHRNHGCCVAGIMGPNKVAGVSDTSYDNDTDDEE